MILLQADALSQIGTWASIISLVLAILFYILAKKQADKADKYSKEAHENIKAVLDTFEKSIDEKIQNLQDVSRITAKRVGKINEDRIKNQDKKS